ncbi:MAG: fasciclin domain-containing protein [Hyphomicrobium sp.]|nr:fasciclin domain-containing protein [Hyphomicrobium sp.]
MSKSVRATLLGASALAAALSFSAIATPTLAEKMEKTVMVGGAEMFPSKNIVQNASHSKDHTTLVAAVKAAGLVDTLSGKGPFTVFAPTNEAFEKLPKDTVPTLLKPENKDKLAGILTYHVVAGKMSAADLAAKAKENGGKVELKTVAGGTITVMGEGGGWVVVDAKGGKAKITIADVNQSNGVIHVIDSVAMPN